MGTDKVGNRPTAPINQQTFRISPAARQGDRGPHFVNLTRCMLGFAWPAGQGGGGPHDGHILGELPAMRPHKVLGCVRCSKVQSKSARLHHGFRQGWRPKLVRILLVAALMPCLCCVSTLAPVI